MKLAIYGPRVPIAAVRAAAIARGHEIITRTFGCDASYVRTATFPPYREGGLQRIALQHARGIVTLPRYEDSLLYDDKRAQMMHMALRSRMPATRLIRRVEDPLLAVMAGFSSSYPFISKSARGAGSHNVRLIRTREEAENEIRLAFGEGIRAHRELQKGYLIWQEFIEGNDHDVRVVINGDHMYGLIRWNRSEEQPFASGSGKIEVIRDISDPYTWRIDDVVLHQRRSIEQQERIRKAFLMAREISSELGTRWACYDFVFRGERCYVLEISFSWVESAYESCPCFDVATLEPNGNTAAEWATFAVMELERMTAARP